ncbi:MAG: thioredoxin [Acidobacteriota bacterium]
MSKTVQITDNNFSSAVLESEVPVLVDFWAPWCGPCRVVGPILEELAAESQDRLTVGKVNVDENPAQANRYGIQGIPTMILFSAGQEVDRIVGALPKDELRLWLDSNLDPEQNRRAV